MTEEKERALLNDPDSYPDEKVLKKTMGKVFAVFQKYQETITNEPLGLGMEWRYYKDGKAWLCKVVRKKKTVHWLSVWPDHFKVAYYFTEKTDKGIKDLPIPDVIKKAYAEADSIGRMKPLIIEVRNASDLPACYEADAYKITKL